MIEEFEKFINEHIVENEIDGIERTLVEFKLKNI